MRRPTPDPRPTRLAAALAFFALALAAPAAPAARGQGFDDEQEEAAPVPGVANVHAFVYTEEQFDQWVFRNGRGMTAFVDSVHAKLAMKIDQVDRACGLSEAQKAKLRLAGRGDLKRVLDAYAEELRFFRSTKGDQNRIQEVLQSIQPLQATIQAGPFGEDSLFAKAVPRALDRAQAERYQAIDRSRRAYLHRARVELAVNLLDNYVGMTADQRHRLIRVIVEGTRPPRRSGQMDYQVILFLASKIPEAKLRPIFDEAQWRKVRAQMDQVQGLEAHFKANGFLPDDEADRPAPAPDDPPFPVPGPGAVPAEGEGVIIDF